MPVPVNPQYPYGHSRYTVTHAPILEHLETYNRIDPVSNPKGAHFAGNISGQTDKSTLYRIMMEDVIQARNAGGNKLLRTPEDGTYGYYRDWLDNLAQQKSMRPMELQAGSWIGHDPAEVAEYNKSLLNHIEDRVNVTAKVMGIPAQEVYQRYVRWGMPLLSAGGVAVTVPGLLSPDQDSNANRL